MAEQLFLFPCQDGAASGQGRPALPEGLGLLRGFGLCQETELLDAVHAVTAEAPFRRMQVPGGGRMSVAMSNCGAAGWTSDTRGYRYAADDPLSGRPWPAMPLVIRDLAVAAAEAAGFRGFAPDTCLINLYEPGARMGLHQDRDEPDAFAPVVSLSLGLPAVFQFGGLGRGDRVTRIVLEHGDVAVWGGGARRAFHGVMALRDGMHSRLGRRRINLTIRKAR